MNLYRDATDIKNVDHLEKKLSVLENDAAPVMTDIVDCRDGYALVAELSINSYPV